MCDCITEVQGALKHRCALHNGTTIVHNGFIMDAFIMDAFIMDAFIMDAFIMDGFIMDGFIMDTKQVK